MHYVSLFKRSAHRLRQGFSLIEVNIAIFVLATGALALLTLFPFGLQQSRNATNEMVLSSCADRFLGAAAIAAEKPGITYDEFVENFKEVSELTDVSENAPSNTETEDLNFHQFKNSNLYYYAWAYEESVDENNETTDAAMIHVGILLSLEKASRYADRRGEGARKRAQLFATKVFLPQIKDAQATQQ
jgi:prepilin-type N-terminal cleavage/methylation domain-containing protein